MNANLIFKWLRDERYCAPEPLAPPPVFLPVEIADDDLEAEEAAGLPPPAAKPSSSRIEITLACGHRIVVDGAFDGAEVASLIRGLTD